MRKVLLLVCGACAGPLALAAGPASAQSYPWCYVEYSRDAPGPSCSFVSREQCMMTARGAGGTCQRNYNYVAPAPGAVEQPALRQRRRRHS